LPIGRIRTAAQTAPAALRGVLDALVQATEELVMDTAPYELLDAAPDTFVQALQTPAGALSEHFNQHPANLGRCWTFTSNCSGF
jgi:hypothetical protein